MRYPRLAFTIIPLLSLALLIGLLASSPTSAQSATSDRAAAPDPSGDAVSSPAAIADVGNVTAKLSPASFAAPKMTLPPPPQRSAPHSTVPAFVTRSRPPNRPPFDTETLRQSSATLDSNRFDQPGQNVWLWYQEPDGDSVGNVVRLPTPEVGVSKWTLSGHARPGGVYVYGVYYANNGDGVATDTIIVDTLPMSTTWVGDTSGFVPAIGPSGVITWNLGNLPPGTSQVFMVTLQVGSDVPPGDNAIGPNCASISTTAPGDDNPGNNNTCSSPASVWVDDAGVNVDKWPKPGDPTPGQEFEYTIRWCSDRGAAAGPVWLTDTLPVSTTLLSWRPQNWWEHFWVEEANTGSQLVLYAPGLPGNMCQELYLRLLLDPAAQISTTLVNHVILTNPGDIDPGNNERINTDAHVSGPRYDMNTNKWYNQGVLVPGGWIRYGASYWNTGNTIVHAFITDTLPPGTSYQPGSAYDHNGQPFPPAIVTSDYVVWDLGLVNVNDGFGLDYTLDISDTVTPPTVLANCVTVGITATESTPGDNTSCVDVAINAPGPNLRVTKWHWWNGDGQLGYQIQFENIGDQTISNVWITDTLPGLTHWDGWWDMGFDWNRLISQNLGSDVLAWEFSELYPGNSGGFRFNANLEQPGQRLRWYTNTVEITTPPNDTTPDDNTYTNTAFSGGEVDNVDLDLYRTRMWGYAPQGPITITDGITEMVLPWDGGFDIEFGDGFMPGEVITVAAGQGLLPVVIHIPDPFTAYASSITDTVWGQIDALDHQPIDIDLWGFPRQYVQTDGSGNYVATYADVPRAAMGDVNYYTTVDYTQVGFHRRFQAPGLVIRVNQDHDWVDGQTSPNSTVWLTVTDGLGVIKGTNSTTADGNGWFNGTNVYTNGQGVDIQPGDSVLAASSDGSLASAQVLVMTGIVDAAANTISGAIQGGVFPAQVQGEVWTQNGVNVLTTTDSSGNYLVDFSPYDLQPGYMVALWYFEPDGDEIGIVRSALRTTTDLSEDNVEGQTNPGVTVHITVTRGSLKGAASTVADANGNFWTNVYSVGNQIDLASGDTVIFAAGPNVVTVNTYPTFTAQMDPAADTISGYGPPDNRINANVWGGPGGLETISDGAGYYSIHTNEPQYGFYDLQPWDQGHIRYYVADDHEVRLRFGFPDLHVEKYGQGQAAPGGRYIYEIRYRNNGNTASTVKITDTLPISVTYVTNSGDYPATVIGSQVVITLGELRANRDGTFYLTVDIDGSLAPGDWITNTAEIGSEQPDGNPADNVAQDLTQLQENTTDVTVWKNPRTGDPAPGEQLIYQIGYHNNGGTGSGVVRVTDTLPMSTTFVRWWADESNWTLISAADGQIVWEFPTIAGNQGNWLYLVVQLDSGLGYNWPLTNTVEIYTPNDTNTSNNSQTNVVWTSPPRWNMSVDKNFNSGSTVAGQQIRYGISYNNNGNSAAHHVLLTDTLPDGVTFVESGYGTPYGWVNVPYSYSVGNDYVWDLGALIPGDGGNFEVVVRVNDNTPVGAILTNTAHVTTSDNDTWPYDDVDSVVDTVYPSGPNLHVVKDYQWNGNNQLEYTIRVDNRGDTPISNILLTDTYPLSTTFGNWWQRWGGNVQVNADTSNPQQAVFWINQLDGGNTAGIGLQLNLDGSIAGQPGLIFTNTATAIMPPGDTNPDDNASTAVAFSGPDVYVEKWLSGGVPKPGEIVTFSVKFGNRNNGWSGDPGYGSHITDVLPAEMEFVNATAPWDPAQSWPPNQLPGNVLEWGWGTMWAGNTWYFDIVAQITDTVEGGDVLTNIIKAYGDSPYDIEPYWANNIFALPVAIINPKFEIAKSYESSRVAGMPLTYTISVTNTGNEDATGIVVTDALPAEVGGGVASWAIGSLAANGGVTQVMTDVILPCTAGTSFTNQQYRVAFSDQGVTSGLGPALALTTIAPTLSAAFSQSAANVIVSSTIYFTDASTTDGPPIAVWEWDFGDNSAHSLTQNASHTYTTNGAFTVRLTVTDTCGYSDVQTATVTVNPPTFVVAFNRAPTTLIGCGSVYFTSTSATDGPPIAAWGWVFGDSGTGAGRTVNHPYTNVGHYTVTLAVTDTLGYHDNDAIANAVIVNQPALSAAFSQSAANVVVSNTVYFTDSSTTDGPPIAAWEWDFGDDSSHVLTQNASHRYITDGIFTVRLTVTDTCGFTAYHQATVTVQLGCTAVQGLSFDYLPKPAVVQQVVTFTADYTAGAPSPTFTWSFDGGARVSGQSVVQTFVTTGTHTVTITATNTCGPVMFSQDVAVDPRHIYLPLVLRNDT